MLYDRAGNEIHEGAILKIFHSIGSRGKRIFSVQTSSSKNNKIKFLLLFW